MRQCIALITDFGTSDGYVGAIKGALPNQGPSQLNITDISHTINAYDIKQAAFCLYNAYHTFPEGTIFMIVVDPGVGTNREALLLKTNHYSFIAPNNGVLSHICHDHNFEAFSINIDQLPNKVCHTFHGRDVFSPVAAKLASNTLPKHWLSPFHNVQTFKIDPSQQDIDHLLLDILHIDHFGNCILNFHKRDLKKLGEPDRVALKFDRFNITGIQPTFGSVSKGELVLTWDSAGFLQLSQNQGNAAKKLELNRDKRLKLYLFNA